MICLWNRLVRKVTLHFFISVIAKMDLGGWQRNYFGSPGWHNGSSVLLYIIMPHLDIPRSCKIPISLVLVLGIRILHYLLVVPIHLLFAEKMRTFLRQVHTTIYKLYVHSLRLAVHLPFYVFWKTFPNCVCVHIL